MALSLETQIKRGHQEIVSQVDAERNRLTVREMNFARLIAEESWTQADAYKEAFQPSEEALPESIQQMACRMAHKPRVAAEIERVKVKLQDIERSKDERLGAALDGQACIQLLALELFAFVMSPSTPKNATWLKAVELLGKQRHVDAWQTTSSTVDDANKAASLDGVKDAGQARARVLDYVKKAIANRINSVTIEAKKEDTE